MQGTSRVSCNRIAEACSVRKGNLHYHYKNKDEIVLAIWARISREIEDNWGEDADTPTIKQLDAATMQEGFQLTLQLFKPLLSDEARAAIPYSFRIFAVE